MKLAVFYHHVQEASRQTGLPLPDILTRIRNFGIRALDCSLEEVTQEGFSSLITAAGLGVASIYAFFDLGNQEDPERARLLMACARVVDCQRVMVIPGFIRSTSDQASPEWNTAVDRMIQGVSRIIAEAARYGIQVTMEDFDDAPAPFATSAQLLRFFDALPELRCAFDTGNFRYSCEDELAAYHRLKKLVVHVHCKDRSLTGAPGEEAKPALDGTLLYSCPTGSGFIKMAEIIDDLLASGYDGWFAIEHFGAPDYLDYIEGSARWLLARSQGSGAAAALPQGPAGGQA